MYGMADQSGNYQEWLSLDLTSKSYQFSDGRDVLIITPDLRFPQGTSVPGQRAADGRRFRITAESEEGLTWKRPDRGTWRWSWYKSRLHRAGAIQMQQAEMRLLKAEGLLRRGDRSEAANIINETRVLSGLSLTDGAGINTSCVPKLPDGTCGDLWEMLKWEKRMEASWTGVARANWWFDGRGWGDLWKDTPLQFPIPCNEILILQLGPCYTFGGPGGVMGSPGSTYDFPFEGG